MYWGFITPDGSFGIVKRPLPNNAIAYRDIVDQSLIKDYAKFGWKLMEDNCLDRRVEFIRDYLAENYVQTIEWRPCSPDLYIIKFVGIDEETIDWKDPNQRKLRRKQQKR